MIANALLLLERRVVLFVDDDEPEPRHRREDGESGAEDEIRVSGRRRAPVAQALPGRQPAVQRDRPMARQRIGNALPNCGVRLISGTRISTCPPAAMHAAAAARYTSVLPLPVTPCSRKGANDPAASMMARCGALLIGIQRHGGRTATALRCRSPRRPMRLPPARPSVATSQQAAAASARARDPAAPGSTWQRTRASSRTSGGNAGTSLRSSTIGCSFSRGTSDSRCDVDDHSRQRTLPQSNAHERAPIDSEPVGNPIIECRFRGDGKGDARDRP